MPNIPAMKKVLLAAMLALLIAAPLAACADSATHFQQEGLLPNGLTPNQPTYG